MRSCVSPALDTTSPYVSLGKSGGYAISLSTSSLYFVIDTKCTVGGLGLDRTRQIDGSVNACDI